MAIAFSCPQCGQRYQVAETLGGKRIKCKKCEAVVTIPAAQAGSSSGRPPLQTFVAPTQPKAKPPLQSFGAPAAPKPAPVASAKPAGPSADDLYGLEEDPSPGTPAGRGSDGPYAAPKASLAAPDDDDEVGMPRPGRVSTTAKKHRRDPAGFWARLCAGFVDGLVLGGLSFGIGLLAGFAMVAMKIDPTQPGPQIFLNLVGMALQVTYFAVMHSSENQATIGKRAMGIIVTDSDGHRLSFGRALAREFVKAVLTVLCLADVIGSFFTIIFTKKKQALHDMVMGTLVVRSR
jgi:uncharacterized RDD family membrane protein YckC